MVADAVSANHYIADEAPAHASGGHLYLRGIETVTLPNLQTERALQRLGQLVRIESPSGHFSGNLECLELLQEWATPVLGSVGSIVTEKGSPHLLWEAVEQPRVLLLGHVDTVWPMGTLAERPFTFDGTRAQGPGVFDMKAGLVVAVEALEIVRDGSHVGLLVTSDEELGSPTSRTLIERVAARYNAVLVLEPSLDGAVKTARKGAGIYQLEITGRAAHAGLEPENGVNALTELAALVSQISQMGSPSHGTTVTPTVARAGTAANAVPAHAALSVDVRAWEAAELERVDAQLRRLAPTHADAGLHVLGGINRPPMEPAHSRLLLQLARSVASRLGIGPIVAAKAGGASDGNFTAALGVPTLDGLGAVGGGAHAEHEWVAVDSLRQRALLVAGLLEKLSQF